MSESMSSAGDKKLWPIDRTWQIIRKGNTPRQLTTLELSEEHRLCLLGSAGLGKTVELERLIDHERTTSNDVRCVSLGEIAISPDALQTSLAKVAQKATESTIIYLDALDEAMVPVARTASIMATWIRDHARPSGARIRLTCRAAVWPKIVQRAALDNAFDEATLEALSPDQIAASVKAELLDHNSFLKEVNRTRAQSLSSHPLTLRLMMHVFRERQRFPNRRSELFEQAVGILGQDSSDRDEAGTATKLTPAELLSVGEVLACCTILSGRGVICTDDERHETDISAGMLNAIDGDKLAGITHSRLCDGVGPRRFRFMHRQIAEYLAGRRLARLLPHQAKSLLAHGLGHPHGVAGPLRETAAFAAMYNRDLAVWIREADPEVIGLSDVADEALRRDGLLGLLRQYRTGKLNDPYLFDDTELEGYRYNGEENDLGPILRERGETAQNLVPFVTRIIKFWQLTSLSDELADLMLDPTATGHMRTSAGYVLYDVGTQKAKKRVKPLIHGSPSEAPDEGRKDDIRALAIMCNYPTNLTTDQLLSVLTPPSEYGAVGAYQMLLRQLDDEAFDASDNPAAGLDWSIKWAGEIREHRHDSLWRIMQRISHAAVRAIDQPEVAEKLATLLIDDHVHHRAARLGPLAARPRLTGESEPEVPSPLRNNANARRLLQDALVRQEAPERFHWWSLGDMPDLFAVEDFDWLVGRALDQNRMLEHRTRYAEMLRIIPWRDNPSCVERWLATRNVEPLASVIKYPLLMEFGSRPAREAKRNWLYSKLRPRHHKKQLDPSPSERVLIVLQRCEENDPTWFSYLCEQLTLEPEGAEYGFERFLKQTPGWKNADPRTQRRIVAAAMQLILMPTDLPEACRNQPFNQFASPGTMAAIWLVWDEDQPFFDELPITWWARWAWFILRELRLHTHNEPNQSKTELFNTLQKRAPDSVRSHIVELARENPKDGQSPLNDWLELMETVDDSKLDAELVQCIRTNKIASCHLRAIASFVLRRSPVEGHKPCLDLLTRGEADDDMSPAVQMGIAILEEQFNEMFDNVMGFFHSSRAAATRIIGQFTYHERRLARQLNDENINLLDRLGTVKVEKLTEMMLGLFPFDEDAERKPGRAYFVEPRETAGRFRDSLLDWLSKRKSADAVASLRRLERMEPRIKWHRAKAERAWRMEYWNPVPVDKVMEVLDAGSKRLIRSEADVVDGIEEAFGRLEKSLRTDGQPVLMYWNTPSSSLPSPKEEEFISDRLKEGLQAYFREHAIVINREVQIRRRLIPKKDDGDPGEEPDILLTAPESGTSIDQKICVPVEVKRSCDKRAKTHLHRQLVERYMSTLSSNAGVYVVAWLKAPKMEKAGKPIWRTIDAARRDLQVQADELSKDKQIDVRAIVIDMALH